MIAEARDLDAGLLAGLDQRDAVLDLDFVPSMISCLGMRRLLPLHPGPAHFAPCGLTVARISAPATSAASPIQNTLGS